MQSDKTTAVPIGKHRYQLKLTLGRADQVLEATGVDLIGDDAANELIAVVFDQRKLADVLWHLCEPAATANGVDRGSFMADLDGDTLTAAWGGLVDAIVNFIPPHRRQALTMTIDKQMEAVEAGAAKMAQVIGSNETSEGIAANLATLATATQAQITKALAE